MSASAPLVVGVQPKHAQLRERIVELAVPGQAIPSERDLMGRYGVSRATVRRAIDGLVADGLLQRIHGLGTFAVRPRVETDLHLASFTQDMRRRGFTPSTRVLAAERERPPHAAVKALELGPDETAWRVRRLRYADGISMAHEVGWYAAELLPNLDQHDLSGSLYELFGREYHLRINSARQILWSESADEELANTLGAPLYTPLLVFQRTSRFEGRPVEHVLSHYRGDRYQIHMDLNNDT